MWLFSGTADSVVPPPVMVALEAYYKHFVPAAQVTFKKDIAAEHAMPTTHFGNACSVRGSPFINDCNFDGAGALLKWIYGPLQPRQSGALGGRFVEFDQAEFLPSPANHGMWPTGWAYVPAACEQQRCRVHVVFHGCQQYPGASFASGPQGRMGDTYVKHTGYNAWADTNQIIVLYPQANTLSAASSRQPFGNPNGCWDWWGYDDANYAKKSGRQMAAVRKMLERLGAARGSEPGEETPVPAGFCGQATNLEHVAEGRAEVSFFWWFFAKGSNDFLGFGGNLTTLKETAPSRFEEVSSCP